MPIDISNTDLFVIYMLPLLFMIMKWITTKVGKGDLGVFHLFLDMSIFFFAQSISTFLIVKNLGLFLVNVSLGFSLTIIALTNATDYFDDRAARIIDIIFPFLIFFLQYLPVISNLFG